LPILSLQNKRAVRVDPLRPAYQRLVADLDPNPPSAQAKMRFPPRAQSRETALFKLSIASVEVLNQSR
jgi:hypothetical protein